jgi:hypothetical protein
MSNIFYFPRAHSLPGAKLTFSVSGTTTLQNTYQDVLLQTPHQNPVTADADGYFAPIYLDPSLPNYRIKHTTSANVLIEQLDGIPAAGSTGQSLLLSSVGAALTLEDTSQASGERRWKVRLTGSSFAISTADNSGTATDDAIVITQNSGIVSEIRLGTPFFYASDLLLQPLQAVKTTATARASTTTFAADSVLQVALPEGGYYQLELYLRVVGNGSSGAGGFKWKIVATGTVGANGIFAGGRSTVNSSDIVTDTLNMETGTSYAAVVATGDGEYVHYTGFAHFTTSGAMSVHWAQNSSNINATSVMAGSYIKATKLGSATS